MTVERKFHENSEGSKGAKPALPEQSRLSTTLPEQAYRQLEEWICNVQLAPGEVLSEIDLANRLDIGRTPVREALQRLASEGLVVILPRRGVLVSEINIGRQLELIEVRRVMEHLMAESAAVRAGQAEREGLTDLANRMETSVAENDIDQFLNLEQEFNILMIEACRNRFAGKLFRLLNGQTRQFWNYYKDVLDLNRCSSCYIELSNAIARGNSDEAAKCSDRLIDYIDEFTHATLKQKVPGGGV